MYIVLACIPLMLLVKPIYASLTSKKHEKHTISDDLVKKAIIHALGSEPKATNDNDYQKQVD